jgi:hypothetical protein
MHCLSNETQKIVQIENTRQVYRIIQNTPRIYSISLFLINKTVLKKKKIQVQELVQVSFSIALYAQHVILSGSIKPLYLIEY